MKRQNINKNQLFKAVLLTALALMLATPAAWAVGTASGTPITNRAEINYSVGGVGQTPIESSPVGNSTAGIGNGADTRFYVDNIVNVEVVSLGDLGVIPGQTDRVLGFTVTNLGNTTQGYAIEVVNSSNIPMNNVRVYWDADNSGDITAGDVAYTPGSGANMRDLNPNGSIGTDDVMQVIIVADTDAGASDGAADTYWLRAVTLDAGTTTVTTETNVGVPDSLPDDPNQIDVVFYDGDGDGGGAEDAQYDGRHIDGGTYTVGTATLSVQKTAAVVEDPVLGVDPNAKAIPGARVRYTVDMTNSSTTTAAQGVVVTDSIPGNTAFVVGSVAGGTGEYSNDNGATWTYSPSGTTDVSVTDIRVTLPADIAANNGTAQVTFEVVIQ